jgi:hypothetical protein
LKELKGLLTDEQKKTKQLEEQVNTSSQPTQEPMQVTMQQLKVEQMDTEELALERVKADAAVLIDQNKAKCQDQLHDNKVSQKIKLLFTFQRILTWALASVKECKFIVSREHQSNCCKCSTRRSALKAASIIPRAQKVQRVAATLILLFAGRNVICCQATQATPPAPVMALLANFPANLLPNLPVPAMTLYRYSLFFAFRRKIAPHQGSERVQRLPVGYRQPVA